MTNQIKTITLSTGTWVLADVPKECHSFRTDNTFLYMGGVPEDQTSEYYLDEKLPAGHTYTLVGKASELKEKQWETMVEMLNWEEYFMFKDYVDIIQSGYNTATASGLSLLRRHMYDPETTVILKQND